VPDVNFAHNDAEAMKRFVIDVLGFREGNIIDLRDATKGRLETLFGTASNPKGQLGAPSDGNVWEVERRAGDRTSSTAAKEWPA
jgi:hypothetical protein